MKGGLGIVTVTEIVVADVIRRRFGEEIEIAAQKYIPADRREPQARQDKHGVPAFMIVAAPLPAGSDELQPPPADIRLPEAPMTIRGRNRERRVGAFLAEMGTEIGISRAHDR